MTKSKRDQSERDLIRRAEELENQAIANPFQAIEVDVELAEHMGAFREEAVGEDDAFELEREVIEAFALTLDEPNQDER